MKKNNNYIPLLSRYLLVGLRCVLYLLISFCFLHTTKSKAQLDSSLYRNNIDINIGELFFRDIKISYERIFFSSEKFKIELGYKFPKNSDEIECRFESFEEDVTGQTWYYISVGYGWFTGIKKKSYLNFDLYYKYSFYEKKYYISETGAAYHSSTEYKSKYQNILGGRLLWGKKYILKNGIYFDFYTGLGIRIKTINEIIYGGAGGYDGPEGVILYDNPIHNYEEQIFPTIHLGVKIGYGWNIFNKNAD